MTVHGTAATSVGAPAPGTSPEPPQRERDALEGLMTMSLFPVVKPHRERLVDILRAIDRTQTGRELLHDFRILAARGRYPAVDLADPKDVSLREDAKPHGLFLSESALTAGASEIGLAPEVEQAPAVIFRLAEIRNSLARQGQDGRVDSGRIEAVDVPMDPVATVVAFRKELQASGALGPRPEVAAVIVNAADPHLLPHSRRPSNVPSPYGAVTESAAVTTSDVQSTGRARRVFRWADQKVQAFRDFLLRRREVSSLDSPHPPPGSPSSDTRSSASVAGLPDKALSASGARDRSNAKAADDRPIIKETKEPKTSRHKRTFSVKHVREVREEASDTTPVAGRSRADTTYTRT